MRIFQKSARTASIVILAAASLAAQQTAPPAALPPLEGAQPTFHAETKLVLVAFQVMHGHALVRDLQPENVRVLADGVPQPLAVFEGGRTAPRKLPMDVILLFDCSESVRSSEISGSYPGILKRHLLDEKENVRIAVYGFSQNTYQLLKPTRDVDQIAAAIRALDRIPPQGTPMTKAIMDVAWDVRASGESATRMLVLVSDGLGFIWPSAFEALRLVNLPLYPVLLLNGAEYEGKPPAVQMNEMERAKFLEAGPATGGRSFSGYSAAGVLNKLLDYVAEHTESQYLVGFYPSAGTGRGAHRISVVLSSKSAGEVRGGDRTVVYRRCFSYAPSAAGLCPISFTKESSCGPSDHHNPAP